MTNPTRNYLELKVVFLIVVLYPTSSLNLKIFSLK